MSLQLSPVERRALKARAHALDPTVLVGSGGLTPAVAGEIDRSLSAHELIKVRVMGDDHALREDILKRICEDLDAAPVQHIGKILVIYRPKPEEMRQIMYYEAARNLLEAQGSLERDLDRLGGVGIPDSVRKEIVAEINATLENMSKQLQRLAEDMEKPRKAEAPK